MKVEFYKVAKKDFERLGKWLFEEMDLAGIYRTKLVRMNASEELIEVPVRVYVSWDKKGIICTEGNTNSPVNYINIRITSQNTDNLKSLIENKTGVKLEEI